VIIPVVQRWRERRASYRPKGEPFDPHGFEVAPIPGDKVARAFVEEHHYSGTYVAARRRFGLYAPGGALEGVAVFSQPVSDAALDPLPRDASVELGRLVLLPTVRANGETWFIARAFELLRRDGFAGVLSFADPEPRATASGEIVFKGHLGTIYQSTNAVFVGRGTARTLRLLADGRVVNARALAKIRADGRERGGAQTVAALVAAGAPPLEGDPATWLRTWLPRVTRTMRHRGNFKYLFGLDRAARRCLPESLPYPKFDASAAVVDGKAAA
jgi:hypothetical protein